jgi:hypothetical protein
MALYMTDREAAKAPLEQMLPDSPSLIPLGRQSPWPMVRCQADELYHRMRQQK